ncbi:MAG TPA: caspase family protein [Pseudonocardiaceae bacterium]|jgi:YVTN family beta-propeller protein|nr:caspase family protein [Pseudonocardiaceae bacterium]
MGRRLALLVATYQYEDTGFSQLTAPAHDAEAFAEVLRDPRIAGFEVTTLINAPRHRVGEAIGGFYTTCRRDDLTLLYFTGHGHKDEAGRLYIVMTDTHRDSLLFTGLAAEDIEQAISTCPSQQKILILDCCYSGAYPAGLLPKGDESVEALAQFEGRGRTVLTASDATQYAFDGERVSGRPTRSVFTRHLVAGLRDGSADLDEDGDIHLDELYQYARDRVIAELPQQRPKRLDNVDGRTLIAHNVNWALPLRVRDLVESRVAEERLAALVTLARLGKAGSEVVRATALEHVRRLAGDDSKSVSSAAAALLAGTPPAEPTAPAEPSAPTEPTAPAEPAARRVEVEPPLAPETERAGRAWYRRRWIIAAAAAAVLIVLAGVLVPRLVHPGSAPPSAAPSWTNQNLPFGGIVESRDHRRIYVANFADDTMSVIDPANQSVVGAAIPVGSRPEGMAVTADDRHVYVADSDDSSVSVVDPESHAVRRITVPRGPFAVTAALDRPFVYVTNFDARTVTVVDAVSGQPARKPIALHGHPLGIVVHPQGHRVYVVDDTGTLSIVDTATGRVTPVSLPPGYPYGLTTDPEGVHLYVTTLRPNTLITIDTATHATLGPPVTVPGGPFGVAAGPNGLAYVTNFDADGVVTVDTTTGRVVGSPIHVPIAPRGLLVHGRTLYVTDGAGTVSVVDTVTRTTVGDPIVLAR